MIQNSDGSIILTTKVDNSGLKKGMSNMSAGIKKLAGIAAAAFSISAITNYVKAANDAYKTQMTQETKLATVLKQRTKATDDQVQSILDLAAAEQKLGIIGDEVQLAGAQQLATFVNQTETLETLIPAMNNLVAQQAGFDATAGSATNVANLMGKALMGQASALRRVGITFSEDEEKVIKFGNEEQRAAMLAKVITNNVGEMNHTLAQTDVGRQKQLANTLGDVKEQFGQAFTQIGVLLLPILNSVASVLSKIAKYAQNVAQALANIFGSGSTSTVTAAESAETAADTASAAMGDLADNTAAAGKAAQKTAASFDELNILSSAGSGSSESTSDDTSSIGGLASTIEEAKETAEEASPIFTKLTELKEAFSGLSDIDFSALKTSAEKLFEPLKGIADISWDETKWAIKNVFVPMFKVFSETVAPRVLDTVANLLKTIKTVLGKITDTIKPLWTEYLRPLFDYLARQCAPILDDINKAWEDFNEELEKSEVWGEIKQLLENILPLLQQISKLVVLISTKVTKLTLDRTLKDLKYAFEQLGDSIGLVISLLNLDFPSAWEHLQDLLLNNNIKYAKGLVDSLCKSWESFKDIIKPIADDFGRAISTMWNNWKTSISNWWNNDVAPWFTIQKWKEVFFNIGKGLANAFTGVGGFVDVWKERIAAWWNSEDVQVWFRPVNWEKQWKNSIAMGIYRAFTEEDGVVKVWAKNMKAWWDNDVAPWFTADKWKAIGTAMKNGIVQGFEGVVNGVKTIINKVIDALQSLANAPVKLLNAIIDGWNNVASKTDKLPELKHVKLVDLSRYKLPINPPKMATGGIVPHATLAQIGEHGREAVLPLENNTEWMDLLADRLLARGAGGYGGDQTVVINVDGREFGRAVVKYGQQQTRVIGAKFTD